MRDFKVQTTSLVSVTLAVCAACASTQPIPPELIAAREAYNRAAAGPGSQLAPTSLHTAARALERAQVALKAKPADREARDLAYIAEREAQLAESAGSIELAKQERTTAEKALLTAQAEANELASKQLAAAREELAQARLQTKDALRKLSGLKNSVREDERGLVITLASKVLFGSNRSILLPAAQRDLDQIAAALVGAKSQSIVIEGHTDSTGPAHLNHALSGRRAQAVVDYLAQKGIEREQMEAQGKGPTAPIADNRSAEGRASNRRVEIVVQGRAAAARG